MDDTVVVLRQHQPRWVYVPVGVITLVFLTMVVGVVTAGDPRHLISYIPTAGLVVLGCGVVLRPPRIELHGDALVTRTVRTVRVPYADIVAVRGDVPTRLDWSTHLVVERRDGTVVKLPQVELPLAEVHDLVVSRAELGGVGRL